MTWGAYTNKVKREAFLAAKPKLQFAKPLVIEPQVKEFKGGKFGWQVSKPNQKVTVALDKESVDAQVMVSCKADIMGKVAISSATFFEAKPLLDVAGIWDEVEPREFQTTSLGWHAHRKQTVNVAGEEIKVLVNFEAVLKGTKEEPAEGPAASEEPVQIDDTDDEPLVPPLAKRAKAA
mmetsp:Transcript_40838/g.127056  ORF Transcript_40838/g.127056 Transcript_40838/m.127056 type:complete len:178 (-) Transcript_40838:472-1005(-)